MKPMLARTWGTKYDKYPCYIQPKLNGVRALYQNGTFQSRGEKLWKPHFFPHITDQLNLLQEYIGPKMILDGEFYVHGWKLQRINSAVGVNNNNPNEDTAEIKFQVFDVVNPEVNFSRRWFNTYHVLNDAGLPHVSAVATAMCVNDKDMLMHFEMYTRLGYEGIMLRPDGPYEFGEHLSSRTNDVTQYRSKFLWKHKQWEDGEFFCVGTTEGEGKADIGIGALVLCVRGDAPEMNGNITFKVGTGYSDEERVFFKENPPLGKLIRVRYLCLSDGQIPLNPSFLAVMN